MTRRFARLFLFLAASVAAFGVSVAGQSPIGSFPPPPASLEELWNRSDVVAHVRVESTKLRSARTSRPQSATAIREHTLQVIELFKGTLPKGRALTVSQEGGVVVAEGREVVTKYQEKLLDAGSEEILFLHEWPSESTYTTTSGPPGVFRLTPDRKDVEVPESMRRQALFSAAKKVPLQAFVERLRSLKGGK